MLVLFVMHHRRRLWELGLDAVVADVKEDVRVLHYLDVLK